MGMNGKWGSGGSGVAGEEGFRFLRSDDDVLRCDYDGRLQKCTGSFEVVSH